MVNPKSFYESLNRNGIDFYTGVPDSLLKDICSYISDNALTKNHIIATNEGGAIALAMGYYLASNKIPLVYMQNSGFGNTINPLLSLADRKVYGIPMLLLIGWRGEPGLKDEPQHVKQGEVSEILLRTLGISYSVISNQTVDIDKVISNATRHSKEKSEPYAILVRKGSFKPYSLKTKIKTNFNLSREEAIIKTTELISDHDIIVATTGKTSRELFEFRARNNHGHHRDFLTVGGMGHANQIALGIALQKPKKTVYCFDGDGAILMHTGSIGIIGNLAPNNFKHIIFNNGSHDSVGGQPTIGFEVNFGNIAEGFNYNKIFKIEKISDFNNTFKSFQKAKGPCLLEILVNKGSRKDLGRPTISPSANKNNLIQFIQNK